MPWLIVESDRISEDFWIVAISGDFLKVLRSEDLYLQIWRLFYGLSKIIFTCVYEWRICCESQWATGPKMANNLSVVGNKFRGKKIKIHPHIFFYLHILLSKYARLAIFLNLRTPHQHNLHLSRAENICLDNKKERNC